MTGVGTVIKTGDYVDMVVGIRADKFPVITTNPADDSFTVVAGLNGTSVKLLLQGMQVLGTLLPPPTGPRPLKASAQLSPDGAHRPAGDRRPRGGRPAGRGHQVRPDGRRDQPHPALTRRLHRPGPGQPIEPPPLPDATTGIILKSLVDRYGVLPPELIETVLPSQARR